MVRLNPKIVNHAQNRPPFFDRATRYCVLTPNMLIFLKSGYPGESTPEPEFLILGYGKKSNFRDGTPNLGITSERGKVGTIIMFRSGQGIEWYQVCPDSLPPSFGREPVSFLPSLAPSFGILRFVAH